MGRAPRPFGLGAFALIWRMLVDRPLFALLWGEIGGALPTSFWPQYAIGIAKQQWVYMQE